MITRRTLGFIASAAITAALAGGVVWAAVSSGSGGETAGVPQTPTGTPTPSASPVPDATPARSVTPTPAPERSPEPLPSPEAGYEWYETPSTGLSDELGVPPYAVQIPENFLPPTDVAVANEVTFLPPGVTTEFPYPPIPSLTILVSPVETDPPDPHTGWQHPFVWRIGTQGGGGCTGDVEGHFEASPSSQLVTDGDKWDLYTFKCSHENLNYPPGVTYDGRAAELRVEDRIISILTREPQDSEALQAPFQTAVNSFTLR